MLMCCKDNEKINLMNMFAEKKFVCLHDQYFGKFLPKD